jgi:hypothetical protein
MKSYDGYVRSPSTSYACLLSSISLHRNNIQQITQYKNLYDNIVDRNNTPAREHIPPALNKAAQFLWK